jgi:hypothetical protein
MKTVCRPLQRSSKSARSRVGVSAIALSVALGVTPMVLAPSVAQAQTTKPLVVAFAGEHTLTASELAKLRGGWYLPTGGFVNFGMEIQHFVNNVVDHDVVVNQVDNHWTETDTTPTGTTTGPLTKWPTVTTTTTDPHGGSTTVTTSLTSSAITTLVQNTANNLPIQTITTVNVSTQGFQNALHGVASTAQILNTIQMNSWMHH